MITLNKHKAIALFSGGLDSIVSVKYMQKIGYTVIPVFFETPFFPSEKARNIANINSLDLQVIDITDEHLGMLKNPRYGFGKYMNPCVDCHGLMFRKAGELLPFFGADFIISGEVLGQRPMSQRKDTLQSVLKLSNVKDFIIRPLSQKLLPDTFPITEGWVNKAELLDIQGRGRHRQIELAKELDVLQFPNPGGGCLLTDKNFSERLKDLFQHDMVSKKNIEWLKMGRHFRLHELLKVVVGRDENENEQMNSFVDEEIVLECSDYPGPLAIIISKNELPAWLMEKAASLFLRYHSRLEGEATVSFFQKRKLFKTITTMKMDTKEVKLYQM
jgi:tRNA U34 2-thiouridine synthase MnmA/TrmU